MMFIHEMRMILVSTQTVFECDEQLKRIHREFGFTGMIHVTSITTLMGDPANIFL
jgi:hypothetical protein